MSELLTNITQVNSSITKLYIINNTQFGTNKKVYKKVYKIKESDLLSYNVNLKLKIDFNFLQEQDHVNKLDIIRNSICIINYLYQINTGGCNKTYTYIMSKNIKWYQIIILLYQQITQLPTACNEIITKKEGCWAWWAFPTNMEGKSETSNIFRIKTCLTDSHCTYFFLENAPPIFFKFHTKFKIRIHEINDHTNTDLLENLKLRLLPKKDHGRFYWFINHFNIYFSKFKNLDFNQNIRSFSEIITYYINHPLYIILQNKYDSSK